MGTSKGGNTQTPWKSRRRKSQLKTKKRLDMNNEVLKKLKLELNK
jgi:hypothetical protein